MNAQKNKASAMITLYGGPTPNARKIGIALHEMDLAWRLEPIDILAGDQLTPQFLALNPNNKTPVIIDDEGPGGRLVLWETGAILLYLAEKTERFVPADPAARATGRRIDIALTSALPPSGAAWPKMTQNGP